MATDERAREIIAASAGRARAEAEEWEARRQHNQSWDHLDAARERLHTATAEEWDALLPHFRRSSPTWPTRSRQRSDDRVRMGPTATTLWQD